MPNSKEEQRVFIDKDNLATICCPKCNYLMVEEITENQEGGIRIEYTCRCGHTYEVFLERRHFYRKSTHLQGFCTRATQDLSVVVIDISLTGVKFKCDQANEFKIGDILYIEFQLDDPKHSTILKKIKIKTIDYPLVGAEFLNTEDRPKIMPYLYIEKK